MSTDLDQSAREATVEFLAQILGSGPMPSLAAARTANGRPALPAERVVRPTVSRPMDDVKERPPHG
jgi:hypothetical protein